MGHLYLPAGRLDLIHAGVALWQVLHVDVFPLIVKTYSVESFAPAYLGDKGTNLLPKGTLVLTRTSPLWIRRLCASVIVLAAHVLISCQLLTELVSITPHPAKNVAGIYA